jgi:hypothetical protein
VQFLGQFLLPVIFVPLAFLLIQKIGGSHFPDVVVVLPIVSVAHLTYLIGALALILLCVIFYSIVEHSNQSKLGNMRIEMGRKQLNITSIKESDNDIYPKTSLGSSYDRFSSNRPW